MSTTGATDEQIEAAASEAWNETGATVPIDQMSRSNRDVINHRLDAKEWASRLVKPGQVITDAARVPTDAEITAISWFVQEDYEADVTSDYLAEWNANAAIVRAYLERVTG